MGACCASIPPCAGLSEPSGMRTVFSPACLYSLYGEAIGGGADGWVCELGGAGLCVEITRDP